MSGFALDWLRLREGADLAARSPALARRFAAALKKRDDAPLRLVDLGAGSGANCRAVMPRIAGDQEWILIDQDRALIAAQGDEFSLWARRQGLPILAGGNRITITPPGRQWRIESLPFDLSSGLGHAVPNDVDGFTAAAFFDLVSTDWVEGFAAELGEMRVPMLAALNVDGRRLWEPMLDDDAIIAVAFAQHQTRDKGFGTSLGGDAPRVMEAAFTANGFTVEKIKSDWQLGSRDSALIDALIGGEANAAREASPAHHDVIARWESQRRAQLANGSLRLTIGHCDLLAIPT
jgi:hypothetical protein